MPVSEQVEVDVGQINPRFRHIVFEGWSARDQQDFVREYGTLVRKALIVEMGRRFGSTAIRGLSAFLSDLQTSKKSSSQGASGNLLDLACSTWQAVWLEIFKSGRNSLIQYAEYAQKRANSGNSSMKFETFLWGLVNLKLRQQIPLHKKIFSSEISLTGDEDEGGDSWEESLESPSSEEPVSFAFVDDIDIYWEGILICDTPDPDEVRNEVAPETSEESLLCWACSSMKWRLKGSKRENLLAFVTFFLSQQGQERAREPLPKRNELNMAAVSGKYLRWEEDVCKIFNKDIRKDRVIAQIQKEIQTSPFGQNLEN